MRLMPGVLLAVGLFVLTGCQKALNYEKSLPVEPGSVQTVVIDAPIKEQKISVVTSSPGVPVDVYILLEEDLKKAEDGIQNGQAPDQPLASKLKAEEATLEATIPAKKSFAVVIYNSVNSKKKAEVKVKATSK